MAFCFSLLRCLCEAFPTPMRGDLCECGGIRTLRAPDFPVPGLSHASSLPFALLIVSFTLRDGSPDYAAPGVPQVASCELLFPLRFITTFRFSRAPFLFHNLFRNFVSQIGFNTYANSFILLLQTRVGQLAVLELGATSWNMWYSR
jgi:hypothetical protein